MRKSRFSKFLAVLLSGAMVLGSSSTMIYAAEPDEEANHPVTLATTGLNVESHTIEEIRDFAENHPASLNEPVTYTTEPDVTSGSYTVDSLGVLSDETQKSALNLLNQIRYISGIDGDVEIGDNYSQAMSAATFLNYLNGALDHNPVQPEGVSDDLYELGYTGAGEANLHSSTSSSETLNESIISWMYDSRTESNKSTVGHRRWILNPTMSKTAFGVTNGTGGMYAAMYAFDRTGTSEYSSVAWPAQNTPIEYYTQNTAWSISIGSTVNADDVTVTVVRDSDGAEWTFSSTDSSDGYFNVNNGNYGQIGCIIFQPEGLTVSSGDTFTVTITGATTDEISYTVNFFDLEPQEITEDMFEVYPEGNETYTGEPITKEITSPAGLVLDQDYTVSYSADNINVGTVTITIKGINNYGGELEYTFEITPAKFGENDIDPQGFTGDYDGDAHSITVNLSGAAVGATVTYSYDDSPYTTDNPSFTDIGVYTVNYKVNKENYEEVSGQATVNITKPTTHLSDCTITIDPTSYDYDGTAKEPTITVEYGSTVLTPGEDYTVSYDDNVNAGTVTVTATGNEENGYSGELTGTFTINPASIENAQIALSENDFTYDGTEKAPAVTEVTLDGKTLVEGTDYTIAYSDNIKAGTAKVTITGTGNYTETASREFTINKATYDMSDVSFEDASYTYDGNEYALEITGDLPDGVTVSYPTGNTLTDVGSLEVTASFTGDYDNYETIDDMTATLTILPAVFGPDSIEAKGYEGYYDGEEHSITVTLSGEAADATVTYSTDGGVTYTEVNPSYDEIGEYTVYYKVSKDNYDDVEGSLTVKIMAIPITEEMFDVDTSDVTYTGEPITKEIITDLEEGTDYTVSYTPDNINVGTVTITIEGTGVYTGVLDNYTFEILPLEFDEEDIHPSGFTGNYDGKKHSITVDLSGAAADATVTYSMDPEGPYEADIPSFTEAGTYTVYYKVSKENYADVYGHATVTIQAIEITEDMFTVDTSDATYTGEPITKEIITDLEEGTDYEVSYTPNTDTGKVTITITGIDDYTGKLTYTFTIRPAEFGEGDVTALGFNGSYDKDAHSITVDLSGAAEGATVTYSTEKDGKYTEEIPEFIDAGTYTVYYKVSKANYKDVTGSATVDIAKLNIKTEATVTVTATDLVYNGTRQNAGIVVTAKDGTVLKEGVDYFLNGQTAKAAGTHKATITAYGNYYETTTVNYKIAKAPQELTAKVKKTGTQEYSVKASKLKKGSKTFKIKVTKKGKMKVRYSCNNSKIKINKNGKVTLKKGLKAGTYKIKVTTGASKNYKANKTPIKIMVNVE